MRKTKNKKVVCAMSGGVDSSVAAYLLKEQGYDVIGVFMRFWAPDEVPGMPFCAFENLCCSADARQAAEKTANKLKIPFHVLDLRDFFKKTIVSYFIDEYMSGRTPNPCVLCGQKIKFGVLFQKALKIFEADFLATGHYVRVAQDQRPKIKDPKYKLLKGKDENKDQSYFLYTASQEVLKHFLFPLGDYKKEEVRRIAKENGLPSSTRKESQEICFVPFGDYKEFLKTQVSEKKFKAGKVLDTEGREIGTHSGLAFYTIGQRRGIQLRQGYAGQVGTNRPPLYVVGIDAKENVLIVGEERELYKKELVAKNLNWISGKTPKAGEKVKAKIRYNMKEQEAVIYSQNNQLKVVFKNPQRAITPGQSVVLYATSPRLRGTSKDDEVLGGGIIEKTL